MLRDKRPSDSERAGIGQVVVSGLRRKLEPFWLIGRVEHCLAHRRWDNVVPSARHYQYGGMHCPDVADQVETIA
jgi:hypothetical protein